MGVRAININKGDRVVGAVVIKRQKTSILVVAENGYGKRSELDEYRVSHRGGKGVITLRVTDKTGNMVTIKEVLDNDDIVVVTAQGVVIRQPAETIRVAGRNTQGVRLIRLDDGDKIADIAVVPSENEKEEKENEAKQQSIVPEKMESSRSEETKENSAKKKSSNGRKENKKVDKRKKSEG